MILLHDISLAYGDQIIFDHVCATIDPKNHIGLVGANGSGKTTLLKAIAGSHYLDEGSITISKNGAIAYLPQEVTLTSTRSIMVEALSALPEVGQTLARQYELETLFKNNQQDHALLEEYAHLQQAMHLNLACAIQDVEQILLGLGFKKEIFHKSVNTLSEGWKMRLILAQLLLKKADFYLFDEPTNHLDLPAKDWFCSLLANASWGFMLVSHDQYFLDHACTKIYELHKGALTAYNGNYTAFTLQKEAIQQQLEQKAQEQAAYIAKQKATIDRFRAKANKARMAQSMLKSLEKIEIIEVESTQKEVRIPLPPVVQAGKVVLELRAVGFGFQKDHPLFDHASFTIMRGSKVALVAPNGTGKSTLLNVIKGILKPIHGTITFGYNVTPIFFDQDQNKILNAQNTILQEVENACTSAEQRARIRSLLGAFLFSGEAVNKKISVLSGGEKNRVAMVKVLIQPGNLLILDEPTNHLDIPSKKVLLNALSHYQGTILFVSHDRTFLNNLATHIIELTQKGTRSYAGNYDSYLYYTHASDGKEKDTQGTSSPETSKTKTRAPTENQHELKKQLRNIETRIERLEQDINNLYKTLGNASYGTSAFIQAQEDLAKKNKALSQLSAEWELLMQKLA